MRHSLGLTAILAISLANGVHAEVVPTAADVTKAELACTKRATADCLMTLTLDAFAEQHVDTSVEEIVDELLARGDRDRAIELTERYIKKPRFSYLLAIGDWDAARVAWDNKAWGVIQREETDAGLDNFLVYKVGAHMHRGETAEAVSTARLIKGVTPERDEADALIVSVLIRRGEFDEANKLLTRIGGIGATKATKTRELSRVAEAQLRAGQVEKARKTLALFGGSFENWWLVARFAIVESRVGETEAAVRRLTDLARAAVAAGNPTETARCLMAVLDLMHRIPEETKGLEVAELADAWLDAGAARELDPVVEFALSVRTTIVKGRAGAAAPLDGFRAMDLGALNGAEAYMRDEAFYLIDAEMGDTNAVAEDIAALKGRFAFDGGDELLQWTANQMIADGRLDDAFNLVTLVHNGRVPEPISQALRALVLADPDYLPRVLEPLEGSARRHLAIDLAEALAAAGKTDLAKSTLDEAHWNSFLWRHARDDLDRAENLARLAADQLRLGLNAEAQENLDKAYALFIATEDTPAQKTWTIAKLALAAMMKPD